MGKVIPLNNVTKLDLEPDALLERAKGKLEGFVIAGWDKEGHEYFASSYSDGGIVLWLLERCKKSLMQVADDMGED